MSKPNFFIIGAPKCGTTSLASWLSQHPEIFMSPVKEPHFFTQEGVERGFHSIEDYESLFSKATKEHSHIGEASVWYLFSHTAVTRILDYQPHARFIVMLRNPVEMAPSLHQQMIFNGHELERDFESAWNLQSKRAKGSRHKVSPWFKHIEQLQYGEACMLGAQLERLYQTVPKEQVLTVVLDDVKTNPLREYKRVLEFLGASYDGRTSFQAVNSSQSRKSDTVHKLLLWGLAVKQSLGIDRRMNLGIVKRLKTMNRKAQPRPTLPRETTRMLEEYFINDVKRLEVSLRRNLTREWFKS